jgi:hypothetical protein
MNIAAPSEEFNDPEAINVAARGKRGTRQRGLDSGFRQSGPHFVAPSHRK